MISLLNIFKATKVFFILFSFAVANAQVRIEATPDGGLQPRLVNDEEGGLHLLYFKKRLQTRSAKEGHLYYREFSREEQSFGNPVRVSSEAYNLQAFSIARASMSVDGAGRVHVVWYLPRDNQYYYSRSDENRQMFEAQRAMVTTFSEGIDAGADIAAIGTNIALVWGAGDLSNEKERTVYMRVSSDSGESFGPESPVGDSDLGACACCSLAAEFTGGDHLSIAYRSAVNGTGRHMQVLNLLANQGEFSNIELLHSEYEPVQPNQEWRMSACPLSTNDIARSQEGKAWMVFETEARTIYKLIGTDVVVSVGEPAKATRQKNATLAANSRGEKLIAWGEAISHSKGGELQVRLVDSNNEQIEITSLEKIVIPDYSFPAAGTLKTGEFIVLF